MNKHNNSSITLVIDGFKVGGGQEVYRLLIPELSKKFENVNLIILEKTENDLQIPQYPNLKVYYIYSKNIYDFRKFLYFSKIVKTLKSSIVISSFFRSHIWSALSKSKTTELFWLEQNVYVNRSKGQWILLSFLSRRVSKTICVSEIIYKLTAIKNIKNPFLSYNPINFPKEINFHNFRKTQFIFVGRFVEQKNPRLMIKSFAHFNKIYQLDARLNVVGDGPLLDEIIVLAKDLEVINNCIFFRSLSIDDTLKLMSETHTLLSSSDFEGSGLARLEAVACGCCVVTTETSGTYEFFPAGESTGFFIAQRNESDFAKKMYESLDVNLWHKDNIKSRAEQVSRFRVNLVLSDWLRNPTI